MVGRCFFYQTPPNGEHLFVILAPSGEQRGWYLCVNITTRRHGSDPACELRQGEHPNLTAPVSVVVYAEAREIPLPLIQRLIGAQELTPFNQQLIERMQAAALRDDSRLKIKYQKWIRDFIQRGEHID